MAWDKNEFRKRYNTLARIYDPGLGLYRAVGLRIETYRQETVAALQLRPGDTVVDLGCGTGLNFSYLHAAVGDSGHIIGVDLTPAMLAKAKHRVQKAGWNNVTLIEADMSTFYLPPQANGILSTLALATVPDYGDVVAKVASSVNAGARIANFELQWPERWPTWLARLAVFLNRPAGVTPDIVRRRPATAIERYFEQVETRELYFGAAYICSGTAPKEN
ncbi:methyltransferase domain-containing protein [Salinisphaera sp. T31B1]|uniref:class I SAM-dependent methyltransferase n=1 Tax=Salinisphaera sp. T31B1 TaxID=727963 RepID=UPI00333E67B1